MHKTDLSLQGYIRIIPKEMETRKYVISARLFLLPNRTIWVCYALSVNIPCGNTNEKHRAARNGLYNPRRSKNILHI